jgi:iron(III) transport system substrate-binding protein
LHDSEAVKTVGLANRLIAERHRPKCDVFWNNEALRSWQLAERGVFSTNFPWKSFGYRSRRLVINTNMLSAAEAPKSLRELTNSAWRGKAALAYPLFGTTATHFLALRQHWGEEAWEKWCRAFQANDPLVVDGNSVVVQLVGRGEAAVGLTDIDDIRAGQRQGLPVDALAIGEASLLIPNTVGIIHNAPHPAEAERFVDFLTGDAVVRRLVEMNAIEGVSPSEVTPHPLRADYPAMVRDLETATAKLKEIFLR